MARSIMLEEKCPKECHPPNQSNATFHAASNGAVYLVERQCLEGYFNGKVKNNALSIKNGRAIPKRYRTLGAT